MCHPVLKLRYSFKSPCASSVRSGAVAFACRHLLAVVQWLGMCLMGGGSVGGGGVNFNRNEKWGGKGVILGCTFAGLRAHAIMLKPASQLHNNCPCSVLQLHRQNQ